MDVSVPIDFGISVGSDSIEESAVSNIIFQNEQNEAFLKCLNVLKTIVFNLVEYPNDMKYRKINLANPKLQESLFSFEGVFDFLIFIGFEKADDITLQFVDIIEGNSVLENILKILKNRVNNFELLRPDDIIAEAKPNKEAEKKNGGIGTEKA